MKKFWSLGILVPGALAGCAHMRPFNDQLCREMAIFGNSVTDEKPKTVRLRTAWGSGLDGRNNVFFEKECEFGAYPPGDRLCKYIFENSSTEFNSINLARSLECLRGGNITRGSEITMESTQGTVAATNLPGAGTDVEVTVSFGTESKSRNPYLDISARKLRK